MTEPTTIHSSFVLERNYPVTPDKLFAALADPTKKRRWFADSEHYETEQFEMDFQIGGKEEARYLFKPGTPIAGMTIRNTGIYHDIVPGKRVVLSYAMTLDHRPMTVSLATFELVPAEQGTDLILTHQGAFFEGSDTPQMREGGWRTLLGKLAECLPEK